MRSHQPVTFEKKNENIGYDFFFTPGWLFETFGSLKLPLLRRSRRALFFPAPAIICFVYYAQNLITWFCSPSQI